MFSSRHTYIYFVLLRQTHMDVGCTRMHTFTERLTSFNAPWDRDFPRSTEHYTDFHTIASNDQQKLQMHFGVRKARCWR